MLLRSEWARRFFRACEEVTHQDFSELIGAARPVVSAELARFRTEG
jgi:hypothetical protein